MTTGECQTEPASLRRCLAFAHTASLIGVVVGTLVLLSWAIDIRILKSLLPDYASMKPLTALCFVLCGLSLRVYSTRPETLESRSARGIAALAMAAVAAIIALASLCEYLLHLDTGIDRMLFRQTILTADIANPGRMAPATALALMLLALALCCRDAVFPGAIRICETFSLLTTSLGFVAVLGYLYGVTALYRYSIYVSTALHTAVTLVMLGIGVLMARPSRGLVATATSELLGGLMARRILPVAIFVPIVIGWLRMMGQRAGLYGNEFGLALFTTTNVIIFTIVIWLSARSLNRMDGDGRRAAQTILQSAEDLTNANEQLRASDERFTLFMKNLPASAFLKDSHGTYLWGNAAWQSQFPEEMGNLIGKTDAELWTPDIAAVFGASDQKVIRDQAPIQLIETTKTGADVRHRIVSKFPLHGRDGALLIGGVAFDTTESKRLEAQLHQAQKLEAIGLLAGGVAHDFNNLLTVILGYADVSKIACQEGGDAVTPLEEIHKAALRAASLTNQLLAFGRKQVMQPQTITVNAVLSDMQRMLRRLIRENVTLRVSPASDLGFVKADPVQIQQIVLNLAMNAQDAMPDGGSLTIETANVRLDETYVETHREIQPGYYVMLAVSDTGSGMDAGTLAHIFEPFFTTKGVGKGTGLGLATVYGVVKQSGGHIWVYSEPGQGASFKIYLPRLEAPVAGAGAPVRPEPRSRAQAGETLLIAEDEDMVRLLMVRACAKAGYHVLDARNGDEALALSDSYPGMIHLLVTDVIMPGISGRVLADQVTARRPEIQVLFCSGYAENAIVHHGVLSTGVEFLQKPFTPPILLERIQALLAAKR